MIDYITGVTSNWGELSSKNGYDGIKRKIMIFGLVAAGHMIDVVIGSDGHFIRNIVIFFYISNELLSIIENAGKVGLPVPEKLKEAIKVLKKKVIYNENS